MLTTTSDQALQQIITNGVPGTAIPAWGTRMSDADIQAIVGFIRQWEATAPETATPIRGGGGPAWRQNTTQAQNPLDWRALALVTIILAIAFSLVSAGFEGIRKLTPK